MNRLTLLLALTTCWSYVAAHLVVTYPGWRGNNLHSSGRTSDNAIPPDGLGVSYNNATDDLNYPYGMQWIYPCGGMPTSQNRTKWPVTGGAVAFQPGWFNGHQTAFIYINIGLGTAPLNMSHPMLPVFQLTGPTNLMYAGTFCLPQVPLPANISYNIGDNATIQIVETAVHGAALYSCADITFADPQDPDLKLNPVNRTNCFNSSGGAEGGPLGMNFVYTAVGLTAGAARVPLSWSTMVTALGAAVFAMLL